MKFAKWKKWKKCQPLVWKKPSKLSRVDKRHIHIILQFSVSSLARVEGRFVMLMQEYRECKQRAPEQLFSQCSVLNRFHFLIQDLGVSIQTTGGRCHAVLDCAWYGHLHVRSAPSNPLYIFYLFPTCHEVFLSAFLV